MESFHRASLTNSLCLKLSSITYVLSWLRCELHNDVSKFPIRENRYSSQTASSLNYMNKKSSRQKKGVSFSSEEDEYN